MSQNEQDHQIDADNHTSDTPQQSLHDMLFQCTGLSVRKASAKLEHNVVGFGADCSAREAGRFYSAHIDRLHEILACIRAHIDSRILCEVPSLCSNKLYDIMQSLTRLEEGIVPVISKYTYTLTCSPRIYDGRYLNYGEEKCFELPGRDYIPVVRAPSTCYMNPAVVMTQSGRVLTYRTTLSPDSFSNNELVSPLTPPLTNVFSQFYSTIMNNLVSVIVDGCNASPLSFNGITTAAKLVYITGDDFMPVTTGGMFKLQTDARDIIGNIGHLQCYWSSYCAINRADSYHYARTYAIIVDVPSYFVHVYTELVQHYGKDSDVARVVHCMLAYGVIPLSRHTLKKGSSGFLGDGAIRHDKFYSPDSFKDPFLAIVDAYLTKGAGLIMDADINEAHWLLSKTYCGHKFDCNIRHDRIAVRCSQTKTIIGIVNYRNTGNTSDFDLNGVTANWRYGGHVYIPLFTDGASSCVAARRATTYIAAYIYNYCEKPDHTRCDVTLLLHKFNGPSFNPITYTTTITSWFDEDGDPSISCPDANAANRALVNYYAGQCCNKSPVHKKFNEFWSKGCVLTIGYLTPAIKRVVAACELFAYVNRKLEAQLFIPFASPFYGMLRDIEYDPEVQFSVLAIMHALVEVVPDLAHTLIHNFGMLRSHEINDAMFLNQSYVEVGVDDEWYLRRFGDGDNEFVSRLHENKVFPYGLVSHEPIGAHPINSRSGANFSAGVDLTPCGTVAVLRVKQESAPPW